VSDPYEKLNRGENIADLMRAGKGPFNAAWFNDSIDAIKDYQRRRVTLRGGDATESQINDEIFICNVSTQDLPQGAIVGVGAWTGGPGTTDPELQNFLDQTNLDSASPTTSGPFAVLLEPIPYIADPIQVGRAVIAGVVKCLVDFSDATHKYAAPAAANYAHFVSQATPGPVAIIEKDTGTGELWALVLIEGSNSGGGSGITSINADTTAAQLLTVGTAGTDFAVDSVTTPGTSVFNLPDAGPTERGAITTGTQTIAGNKTVNGTVTAQNSTASTTIGASSANVASIALDSTSPLGQFVSVEADVSYNDIFHNTLCVWIITGVGGSVFSWVLPDGGPAYLDLDGNRVATGTAGTSTGGTGSDLSATGPGITVQASLGSPLTVYQGTDIGFLNNYTGGTPTATIQAPAGLVYTTDFPTLMDCLSSLTAQINAIRTILQAAGITA
jgi:hypothetical protein